MRTSVLWRKDEGRYDHKCSKPTRNYRIKICRTLVHVRGYVVKPFLCCVCVCVQSYECGRDGDKQDTVDEFWRVFVGPKAGSYDLRTRAPKRTFPSFPPHSWVLR